MPRNRIAHACLALLLAGIAAGQAPSTLTGDAKERLKEFERAASSEEPRIRAEQMERLAAVDALEAVKLLQTKGLKDPEYFVRERASFALSKMQSATTREAVAAGLTDGNEMVRAGTVTAIAQMKPPLPDVVAKIAPLAADPREEVQVAACEALGVLGAREGVPPLAAACGSNKERVAVAAADALALIRDPSAAPALIKMLDSGTWRTQAAAIYALRALRVRESVRPLISYLKDSSGRQKEDARIALESITTMDFGMNDSRWLAWWETIETTDWKVPPPPPKAAATMTESKDRYGRVERGYHQQKIVSTRLLFVIDISASMLDPIRIKRGRNAEEEGPTRAAPKLDLAREELARVLRLLDENTTFNVIAFETDIRMWKKEPVTATRGSVQEAIQWVERQKPRAISTRGARQSSGLDSDGLMMGRTNTYGALKAVFGLPTRPPRPGEGGTTGGSSNAPKPKVDTVYFLTDGQPTEGETTDVGEILAAVKHWNRSARLIINTIGMSETSALRTLLDGLARETGGTCTFVGE